MKTAPSASLLTKRLIYMTLPLIVLLILSGCWARETVHLKPSMDYNSFPRAIEIPAPTKEQKEKFNADVKGEYKKLAKGDSTIDGYVTSNKVFFQEVIDPILKPHIDELRAMPKTKMISTLALFGHEIFQTYFGKDFYRWAGDINDLDEPQVRLHRFEYRYGLDCSGFSTFSYETAVIYGLLKPEDDGALFSHKGFEIYCKKNNLQDHGARDGGGNNFRIDTKDMQSIGREVFRLEKGTSPTDEQVKMLQGGDLVLRGGHVGTIVEINDAPYFLESGGGVLAKTGYNPYEAKDALTRFAARQTVWIKRALPDKVGTVSAVQK